MTLKQVYSVVFYGARDGYQVPLALCEAGTLDSVLTDFYAPSWLSAIPLFGSLPWMHKLRSRFHPRLSSLYFRSSFLPKLVERFVLDLRGFSIGERDRILDDALSARALRHALRHPEIRLFCYSYYWRVVGEAIENGCSITSPVVFQVHPIASQIKRIIRADRSVTGLTYSPEAEELYDESLDEAYVKSLTGAVGVITASSFTAQGLHEQGVPPAKTRVVFYGSPDEPSPLDLPSGNTVESRWLHQFPLRLLWVGQLAYRKGAHHLFAAISRFTSAQVQLTIATRSRLPDELQAICPPNVQVLHSVSNEQKQHLYRSHHLFVLPSLVEGFGLVYLEALAAGLPILATTNTGAPDVITPGMQGFVIPPGSSEAIFCAIEKCLLDMSILRDMSARSRLLSSQLSWRRFREEIRQSLHSFNHAG